MGKNIPTWSRTNPFGGTLNPKEKKSHGRETSPDDGEASCGSKTAFRSKDKSYKQNHTPIVVDGRIILGRTEAWGGDQSKKKKRKKKGGVGKKKTFK